MPQPGIPFWNDQDIVLNHGTLDLHAASILQGADLNTGMMSLLVQ